MPDAPVRYQSAEEDSGRWSGFPFRDGDIVISTRSKSGTTWMQMICALLVFQTGELPGPLGDLSPWLDRLTVPRGELLGRLAAQRHRRIIKSHTPLDGIPIDPRATYIVVARHPLDMAVSLYHQGSNIDRARLRRLTGQPEPSEPPPPRPPLHDWLNAWIREDTTPQQQMDSLPGVMWHLTDAWARRGQPNIVLAHYDDLSARLASEMRRLAGRLAITVPPGTWPDLVRAATFEEMRAGAERIIGPPGVLKSSAAFFRRGTPGAGRDELSAAELAGYERRAAELAPPDLLRWLHRDGPAPG